MRTVVLAHLFAAGLLAQPQPSLDIVLLVEDSISATSLVRRPDLHALRPGDRMAVMTFSGGQTVKLAWEEDRVKIGRAIDKLDSRGTRSTTRLWDAVVKATTLFGAPDPLRRRAVFLVFSAEDKSSVQTAETTRAALRRTDASLSAAVIAVRRPASSVPVTVTRVPNRTPAPQSPEIWSERVPAGQGGSLPDGTLPSVNALVTETGGLMLKNAWDFTPLTDHVRSR